MATIGTRLHTLFCGTCVGQDAYGNRYYTERRSTKGRRSKRWVIYKGIAEPSKVPPVWHAWLHYTVDTLPTEMQVPVYAWQKECQPNLTGTVGAYVPPGHLRRGGKRDHSTSDYQAWEPGDAA